MTNCDKFKLHYSDYIDGELPSDQCQEVDHHLTLCPTCREIVRQMKIIQQSLRQIPQITTSPDFEAKLKQQILQQNPHRSFATFPWQSWKLPAMGSAIVLATVGLFLVLNNDSGPTLQSSPKPENIINNAAPQLPGKKNPTISEGRSTMATESTTRILDDSLRADSMRINPEGIQPVGVK